jgi:hypothetical protein
VRHAARPAPVARAPSIEDARLRSGMVELLIRLFSRSARRSTARGVIEVMAFLGDLHRLRLVIGVRAARQLDAERPTGRGNSGDALELRRGLRDRPGCGACRAPSGHPWPVSWLPADGAAACGAPGRLRRASNVVWLRARER